MEENNLLSAALNIQIDKQNYIYLSVALIVPIVIAFLMYAITKKM